jgi:hypothetical protein
MNMATKTRPQGAWKNQEKPSCLNPELQLIPNAPHWPQGKARLSIKSGNLDTAA